MRRLLCCPAGQAHHKTSLSHLLETLSVQSVAMLCTEDTERNVLQASLHKLNELLGEDKAIAGYAAQGRR